MASPNISLGYLNHTFYKEITFSKGTDLIKNITSRDKLNSFIDNINYVNDNYEIITKEIIENNPNQKIRTFDIEEYGVDRTYSFHPEKFQIIKEDSYEQGEGYYKIKNIDIKSARYFK